MKAKVKEEEEVSNYYTKMRNRTVKDLATQKSNQNELNERVHCSDRKIDFKAAVTRKMLQDLRSKPLAPTHKTNHTIDESAVIPLATWEDLLTQIQTITDRFSTPTANYTNIGWEVIIHRIGKRELRAWVEHWLREVAIKLVAIKNKQVHNCYVQVAKTLHLITYNCHDNLKLVAAALDQSAHLNDKCARLAMNVLIKNIRYWWFGSA